ncbi:MAG: hypothetical protein KGD70_10430 [Candidatus Lokiarchaeota archaeon]|nr:hypothetical protein [Candidatus Lokiarchaeota archaeon]
MENLISLAVKGEYLEISFNYSSNNKFSSKARYLQKLKDFLFDWKIKIDENLVYDAQLNPNNFHVELNSAIIFNQDLDQIYDINFGTVKVVSIITPNIYKIGEGKHKITLINQKNKFTFYTRILRFDDEIKFPAQSQFEIIKQQVKPLALKEQEIRRYFNKVRKIIFLVVILMYLGVCLYFFSLLLPALLDPFASQFDAGLGPGLALGIWIFLGLFLIPISYGKLRKIFR